MSETNNEKKKEERKSSRHLRRYREAGDTHRRSRCRWAGGRRGRSRADPKRRVCTRAGTRPPGTGSRSLYTHKKKQRVNREKMAPFIKGSSIMCGGGGRATASSREVCVRTVSVARGPPSATWLSGTHPDLSPLTAPCPAILPRVCRWVLRTGTPPRCGWILGLVPDDITRRSDAPYSTGPGEPWNGTEPMNWWIGDDRPDSLFPFDYLQPNREVKFRLNPSARCRLFSCNWNRALNRKAHSSAHRATGTKENQTKTQKKYRPRRRRRRRRGRAWAQEFVGAGR